MGAAHPANSDCWVWLKNWLWALELAAKTGGKVFQVLIDEPSRMQEAEACMAEHRGVPVVEIHAEGYWGQLLDHPNMTEEARQQARKFKAALEKLPKEASRLGTILSESTTTKREPISIDF